MFWAHGSGRVCLGSSGSRSMPSDVDSEKPAFVSHVLSSAPLGPQGVVPQTLTLLRGLGLPPSAVLFRGIPTGPEAFLGRQSCLSYGPAPGPTLKRRATYLVPTTQILISNKLVNSNLSCLSIPLSGQVKDHN